ncbi:MAG: DUF935 family protein [Cyanobacteria bacterium P01_F01_bin.56]
MPLPEALRQEFATLQKSFLDFAGIVGSGFHLTNPDPTLKSRSRGQGLKLYEKVEEDCHAHAVLQQRKLELIGREWKLEPASESRRDKKARDLVEAQLKNLGLIDYPLARHYGVQGFDGVALNFLDAICKGYSAGEPMWATDGSEVVAAEVRHRDQRRFGFVSGDNGYELRLLSRNNQFQGEPIPPYKIIFHSPTATDANPYGLGLDSKIFWPVFFKRQNIQFWLVFADKFGSPTPVGKYPSGTSDPDKQILLDALKSITQGLVSTIPDGMVIEFMEAMRSGSVQTYEGLCRYMDEQISEAVLGQTGTTNQSSGGGSRAQDEVARTGMLALIKADADLLARTLDRTLIRWMVELNRPLLGEQADPPHLYWDFESPENLAERAKRDKVLFDMGFKLTLDKVKEIYGDGYELKPQSVPLMPPMNLSDPLPTSPQPSPSQGEGAGDLPSPNVGRGAGGEGEPLEEFAETDPALPPTEYARELTSQARDTLGPVIDGWVGQIRELMESIPDDAPDGFEQFSEGLIALYPELAKDQFAEIFQYGLLSAHLGGAAEIQAEVDADD